MFKVTSKLTNKWSYVCTITILAQCSRASIPSRRTGVGWSTLWMLGCQLGQSLGRLKLFQELRTSCGASSGYLRVSNITKTFTEHVHLRKEHSLGGSDSSSHFNNYNIQPPLTDHAVLAIGRTAGGLGQWGRLLGVAEHQRLRQRLRLWTFNWSRFGLRGRWRRLTQQHRQINSKTPNAHQYTYLCVQNLYKNNLNTALKWIAILPKN